MSNWKAKQKSKISVSPPAWREQAKKEIRKYLLENEQEHLEEWLYKNVIDFTLSVAQKEIDYLVSQYSEIIKTKDKRIAVSYTHLTLPTILLV